VTPEEREAWIGKLVQLLSDVNDHSRIINADESCWRVYAGGLKTWAPIGSQNVYLLVNGNEKNSFTMMAAIIAARTKLPLCMIAAGKTPLVEHSHFGDVAYHRTMHSESGDELQKPLPNGSVGSAACIPTVSPYGSFLTPTLSIDRRRYALMRRILGSTCDLSPQG
jgi:hypothetical protein